MDILRGVPTSADTASASSSARAFSASLRRAMYPPRSRAGVALHPSNAARAAPAARPASSAEPQGTSAMSSSVAGFTTAIVAEDADATHSPPMKMRS
jgi:hypothetical protein